VPSVSRRSKRPVDAATVPEVGGNLPCDDEQKGFGLRPKIVSHTVELRRVDHRALRRGRIVQLAMVAKDRELELTHRALHAEQ
jgi:hypothetical protein